MLEAFYIYFWMPSASVLTFVLWLIASEPTHWLENNVYYGLLGGHILLWNCGSYMIIFSVIAT